MTDDEPVVVWPAPGFPAFLSRSEQDTCAIVMAGNSASQTVASWSQSLALRPVGGQNEISLAVESLQRIERDNVAQYAGDFLALPQSQGSHLFRMQLRPSRPLTAKPGRTVQLFDLVAKGGMCRSRSVAFFPQLRNCLNLAFASDLHVAQLWDLIGAAVDRYLPEAAEELIRPHRLLECFIEEANRLVACGELDLVVLGGDLVDHVYPGGRFALGTDGAPSNVARLVAMLQTLEAPTLAIPGNHDFPGFPWHPRFYGLGAVGLSWRQAACLLRKAGLREVWPLVQPDLDALRTTDAGGQTVIGEYLTHVNPTLDFACTLNGVRLVLLSSGRDVLPQGRHIERARWPMLLRGLRWVWHTPDSEGFSERQLDQVGAWLRDSPGTAVFFHAPLLASGGAALDRRLSCLEVGPQEAFAERVKFERRLQLAGVRRGVSLCNPGLLLQKLRETHTPVAAFSGHLHAATVVEWERTSSVLRSIAVENASGANHKVLLFTAPALGLVKSAVRQPPGYLLARFEDGKLVALKRRTLASFWGSHTLD